MGVLGDRKGKGKMMYIYIYSNQKKILTQYVFKISTCLQNSWGSFKVGLRVCVPHKLSSIMPTSMTDHI